ncbi:MAG: DNA topoisomerase 3 [Anaerovibrio sp.]|uniref:DNA topoisomerase 3 n=1 Tax=Anaerovibrio sp. TaxID=1872532 RepID=UPI0025D3A399|nr:DNA topoisomerase 3 [Anaerovibrio sp.]MCR5176743.1 DNA topoisomerase 3 [Anaerovibrio sp.]
MRLYIAEKPSMGAEIAKCLPGPIKRGDGFIETGGGTVTWGFGHILRQAEPQEYDEKYKSWRAEDLPIVPKQWKLLVDASCAKQFHIVKKLIEKADEIVHAGDPDREGQLLIDEVLDFVGNHKPVKRILLNALDEKSIKEANSALRENSEFFNLKQSALARARADWLIGMNLSRAYTLAAQRAGHRNLVLPVGRVKTPTLALVVRREREIENFKPVDYYTIKVKFHHANGDFLAVWNPKDIQAGLDSEGRLVDRSIADAKLEEFQQQPVVGVISEYSKTKKQESQRLPFSLSSLQVLAGKRFGYDPQQVLDTAQKLYERKLTTYPRSDCEYLPSNQFKDGQAILNNLKGFGDERLSKWAMGADCSIKSRAWNDKKISAHHAIIPTRVPTTADKLSLVEKNIYFLVAQAYIAQFYPVHVYNQTKIGIEYKDEHFSASGRVVLDLGWKELYMAHTRDKAEDDGDNNEDENTATLPIMKKNDEVEYLSGEMSQKATRPPSRFTPASLLAAMKDIHKFVKDPEAKKKLKDVYGIGTEATRATIIDDLIHRRFMNQTGKKKYLQPTQSAYMLIDAMPNELSYPDFTAIWEDQLHSMAAGDGSLDQFIGEQVKFTASLCSKAYGAHFEVAVKDEAGNSTELCPRCKSGVLIKRHGKNGDFWGCSAFPKCRMTCDDKDGKPDIAGSVQRRRGNISANGNSVKNDGQSRGLSFGYPYISEEEMQAFNQQYQLMPSFSAAFPGRSAEDKGNRAKSNTDAHSRASGRAGNTPAVSAAPMEKIRPSDRTDDKYLCPKCREGSLRKINGRNGAFWGCTNYPRCTATFDDEKNAPVLNV